MDILSMQKEKFVAYHKAQKQRLINEHFDACEAVPMKAFNGDQVEEDSKSSSNVDS